MSALTKKDYKQEQQANAFANVLLMPAEWFKEHYDKVKGEPEEARVKYLAKIFDVPDWAVINRIRELQEILYP